MGNGQDGGGSESENSRGSRLRDGAELTGGGGPERKVGGLRRLNWFRLHLASQKPSPTCMASGQWSWPNMHGIQMDLWCVHSWHFPWDLVLVQALEVERVKVCNLCHLLIPSNFHLLRNTGPPKRHSGLPVRFLSNFAP